MASFKKYDAYLLDEIDRQPKDTYTFDFEKKEIILQSAKVEEEKYEEDKICPISFDEISHPVVNIAGQLYDRPAIEGWYKNNDTDPMTGMCVGPYKYLITVPTDIFQDVQALGKFKKNMRMNTLLWAPAFRYLQKAQRLLPLIQEFKEKLFEGEENKAWLQHQKKLATLVFLYTGRSDEKELFSDDAEHFNRKCTCVEYALIEKSVIPIQTCVERQYRDKINHPIFLCHRFMIFPKNAFCGKNFKSCLFDGAHLSGSVFLECDLSRCSFIGADITGCRFVRCNMIGEQVMFVGAIADTKTQFINCNVEYLAAWKVAVGKEEVRKVLKSRGLEGDVVVE